MAELITQSKPLFETGSMLVQAATFTGNKTIAKVSLNVTVTNSSIQTMVIGTSGVLSFQAANFRQSRNSWAFQPALHWVGGWETSGTTIQNTNQTVSYFSSSDAALNAPYIKYNLFLDAPGVYDLWGYGYTSSEGVFWSWDDDTSDMRRLILGSPSGPPEWTKFGTIFSVGGGQHTFSVYLSDASTVVFDQWYFTQDLDFDQQLASTGAETIPVSSLSKSPFNTAMRVRSLNGGNLDSLTSPAPGAVSITSWLSSQVIVASGKYNYAIEDDSGLGEAFDGGLSMDFWQIGGTSDFFASWDFIFPDGSVGNAFESTDYGQDFQVI